tara:strand:- start:469 stop:1209 length:741 start_codon:yes stop_codon:yes gene_type:complete
MIPGRALALVLMGLGAPVMAAECTKDTYRGNSYTTCKIDVTVDRLELFLRDTADKTYGYFGAIDRELRTKGQRLGFAMNAGMYHEDRAPVGYYLEGGKEVQGVISSAGPGNFGLLPNGVLCLGEGRAEVIETKAFLRRAPDCRSATQSGPMLVIDGDLHPRFLKDGTSRYIRNGVGTSEDGTQAYFVISDTVVNFYDFGSYFRDRLGLRNALYFDGNVSRLRAPDLGRDDTGFTALGPIIGVVEPQ